MWSHFRGSHSDCAQLTISTFLCQIVWQRPSHTGHGLCIAKPLHSLQCAEKWPWYQDTPQLQWRNNRQRELSKDSETSDKGPSEKGTASLEGTSFTFPNEPLLIRGFHTRRWKSMHYQLAFGSLNLSLIIMEVSTRENNFSKGDKMIIQR